ncbi:MAG: alpha/beta hydrolase, partial [Rhodospirillaceae bacterium]|nr:alpha/beta hydrolase [Rhodospirillaceae bacterium]
MANFVLIHGSFQGSWIWQPTVKLLRDAGHIVH